MDFIGSVRLLRPRPQSLMARCPFEMSCSCFCINSTWVRKVALKLFAESSCRLVRSFTTAVIQAEEKGMPLRDILRIQADILRRRVQESEAYIANANLQMLGPVMLSSQR